jgi:hypothetical protein
VLMRHAHLCCVCFVLLCLSSVFPTQDFPAWGRMDIQVQSLFADKTFSVPASYGAGFTPSPYITPNAVREPTNKSKMKTTSKIMHSSQLLAPSRSLLSLVPLLQLAHHMS